MPRNAATKDGTMTTHPPDAFAIGRVEDRGNGTVTLIPSGECVTIQQCPCDAGKVVLLGLYGDSFQPLWWES